MSDSVTEVTSQSWFSRLGNAIKGMAIGAVLFVVAFPLLFWNEGRAVKEAKSLTEGAAAVVSVETDKVDKANEDKLIHISGKAETDETLVDSEFGVSANAIRLTRQVEMYQWVEETEEEKKKKLGGGEETVTKYSYSKEWSDSLNDSSDFHTPAGHENPTAMPYAGFSTDAKVVTIGAFKLSPSLVGLVRGDQGLNVSSDDLSDSLALQLQVIGTDGSQGFYRPVTPPTPTPQATEPAEEAPVAAETAAEPVAEPTTEPVAEPTAEPVAEPTTEPALESNELEETPARPSLPALASLPTNPTVGDAQITFEVVEPAEVSVVASQIGDTFEPYQTDVGRALNMLAMGTKSADTMFAEAQAANTTLTWILRFVGFVVMAIGISMVLRPLSVVGDIVPFIGNLIGMGTTLVAGVCALSFSLLTISVAWLVYRPIIGVPLFLLGVAALVMLFRMARQRAKAKAAAA